MVYFPPTDYKVYAIWMFLATIATEANIHGPQALLRQYVKEFVQPFVESLENAPIFRDTMHRKFISDNMSYFIEHRVAKLKQFLEDDMTEEPPYSQDTQIDLKDGNNATIIEFTPKQSLRIDNENETMEEKARSFQENIAKYQKLRKKIKKALKRDHATNKTRTLVLQTLDKMIDQMLKHKCSWKDHVQFRSMLGNNTDFLSPTGLIDTWNTVWSNLKQQYINTKATNRKLKSDKVHKTDKFLDKFEELMSVMTSDLNTMINKHKVVCHFQSVDRAEFRNHDDTVNVTETTKTIPDNEFNEKDKLTCSNFKLCSEELKGFLKGFYHDLNETAVTVITNYAAMFIRDVNEDSHHEKERVVGLINKTAEAVEEKVSNEFKKQTKAIKLDPKRDKTANMQVLHKYITNTTDEVKKIIIEEIKIGLTSVKDKLRLTILEDIKVNMLVDMGNVESDWISRICQNFVICNGKVGNSRRNAYPVVGNNIYVKLKLDFDDEDGVETTTKHSKTIYRNFRVIVTKAPFRINVTRTKPSIKRLFVNFKPNIKSKAAKFVSQYSKRSKDIKDSKEINVAVIINEKVT